MSDKEDETPPRSRFRVVGGRDASVDPDAGKAAANEDAANDEAIRLRIAQLEEEHRDLDTAIASLEERMPYDRLTIQRLKKRKLMLKDEIARLRDELFPDIIA